MSIRRHQKRFFILLIFVISSILIIHFLWSNQESASGCFVSPSTLKKLDELTSLVQEPLKALDLTFFLCYNSLWGALKVKGPLPWQNSLDLCVLNKEISAIDEGYLARTFKRYGLSINYNSVGGVYKITKMNEVNQMYDPYVTLTVFEEDMITHQMRRVGWIHRMLPPNQCDDLNCFPPDLIAKPLPTIKFNEHIVPIPRDGIEIQKYLFPDSWWKDITPPSCQTAGSS